MALFDQYHNMVYRLSLSYTHSVQDAEDMVQTVFLKAMESKSIPEAGKEKAWLIQVTINACKNLLRSFRRKSWEPLDENIPSLDRYEERQMFELVMSLPTNYRVAVYLHYYEGYTIQEIASFLKLSASAVSMRLHRARSLLRNSLYEEEQHGAAL